MLHINDLTYRIEGKPILEDATAAIPEGHKVGLVGRNGAGKSTLLKLIAGDLHADQGAITLPRGARIGRIAQEAPGGDESLIDWVLSTDLERARLLAEAETATDPHRIAEIQIRLVGHPRPLRARRAPRAFSQASASTKRPSSRSCGSFSGGWRMRVALGSVLFLEPDILLLDEPDQLPRPRRHALARDLSQNVSAHRADGQPRPRPAEPRRRRDPPSRQAASSRSTRAATTTSRKRARAKQRLELKLKKKQDDERRRIQAFIDRFKAKATKAKQAQSRVKALAKMQPIASHVEDRVAPIRAAEPGEGARKPVAAHRRRRPPVTSLESRS